MQRSEPLRVAVLGAGAVGCYFGGMLARAGVPVTLIARPKHVEAIARGGLRMQARTFDEMVRVPASADPAAVAGADVVLLTVKSVDTAASMRAAAPHLAPSACVVSLQNGVDNARQIREHVAVRVIPSVVYVAAEMSGPGWLCHNGRGDLVIGEDAGARAAPPARASLEAIAAMFARAGVGCPISTEIEADLWAKLAMNCAYNAVSALTRQRYAVIAADAGTRRVRDLAVLETGAVARAAGVDLGARDLIAMAQKIADDAPATISSTAQDILLGRLTEIDGLNGHVVVRGRELGVPTPVNEVLHALVKLLERAPR